MAGIRIRWRGVARVAALVLVGLIVLRLLPGFLRAPEPPPLAADVGLPKVSPVTEGSQGGAAEPVPGEPRGRQAKPVAEEPRTRAAEPVTEKPQARAAESVTDAPEGRGANRPATHPRKPRRRPRPRKPRPRPARSAPASTAVIGSKQRAARRHPHHRDRDDSHRSGTRAPRPESTPPATPEYVPPAAPEPVPEPLPEPPPTPRSTPGDGSQEFAPH